MKNEWGYTFVELLTAMMVLGIVIHTAVPIIKEISAKENQREIELEATNLLQKTLEKQIAGMLPCVGNSEEPSHWNQRIRYEVSWHCKQRESQLMEWNVEVQWINEIDKIEKRMIQTMRFIPNN